MMSVMPIICLLETLYDMAGFRGKRFFPGWSQVMSVCSWLVSDSYWVDSGGFTGKSNFQFPKF